MHLKYDQRRDDGIKNIENTIFGLLVICITEQIQKVYNERTEIAYDVLIVCDVMHVD